MRSHTARRSARIAARPARYRLAILSRQRAATAPGPVPCNAELTHPVAEATGTWTNHVGIVLDVSGKEPVIGESRFPFSGSTTLSRFVARSAGGRVAVMRLPTPLTEAQQIAIVAAGAQREHVFYDTGFDARSHRQFCSRYVREVLQQGTGVEVGRIETFHELLASAPQADVGFRRAWYFGSIPWQRETVTPASVLHTPGLKAVFDGVAI